MKAAEFKDWIKSLERISRDPSRGLLSKGFDVNVMPWIEDEIVDMDREIEAAEISEERESWNWLQG